MLFDDLRAIQREFGYLPARKLKELASTTGVPLFRVHEVASFYPVFHLEPQPKVNVGVCADLACHLGGADALCARLKQRFQSSSIGVAVREISCLGQCEGAPAISINDVILSRMDAAEAENLIAAVLSGIPISHHPLMPAAGTLASDPYDRKEPYGALRRLVAAGSPETILADLKASGLGGMGGAGFPAHIKWDVVPARPPGPKNMSSATPMKASLGASKTASFWSACHTLSWRE